MGDAFEDQGWVKLGVAAAMAKEFQADAKAFLPILANALERQFPGKTKIRREGWFGAKHIVEVEVALPEGIYALADRGAEGIVGTRKKVVRGITLKTEEIPMDEWTAEVASSIEEHAKSSEATRRAIAEMLGLP